VSDDKEYVPGLRIVFGDGHKIIGAGTIDDVPALVVCGGGTGVVGKDTGPVDIPSGQEICAFIFEHEGSLDSLIKQAIEAKKYFPIPGSIDEQQGGGE